MNYYERYCGDYARDTAHLVLAEHGAYTLMLDFYYSTERPLQPDHASLYRLCRAISKPEQAVVRKIAEEFFPIGGDGLRHNDRADDEIAKAQKRIAAAKLNGKGGGRPPKQNPPGSPPDNPPGSKQQTQHEPSSPHMVKPPDPRPQSPKRAKATPPPALPDGLPVSPELWAAFREVRRKKKATESAHAESLLVKELGRLRGDGNDPTAVVEQSVRSGWADVYPIKGGSRPNGRESTLAERRSENIADITGRNRGHTIDSDSVAAAPVRQVLSDLREQGGDDVGGLPQGGPHGRVG